MRSFLAGIFLVVFMPVAVLAAGAGFVPSSGIWFSTDTVTPGQLVRVYTVVVNNQYYALDGTIGFYDNDTLIDTVSFKALDQEAAQQIKVLWQPTAGNHVVRAAFVSATAVNNTGKRSAVPVQELTGVSSLAATGSADTTSNQTSPSAAAPNSAMPTAIEPSVPSAPVAESQTKPGQTVFAPSASVVVAASGNSKNLIIAPAVLVMPAASGQQAAPNAASQPSGGIIASAQNAVTTAQDLFAANREALQKAQGVIATISTTVGSAQAAVATGQKYYTAGQNFADQAQVLFHKADPIFAVLGPWWKWVSNNNDPIRIAIIAGITLVILLLFKLRNARYREWYDR